MTLNVYASTFKDHPDAVSDRLYTAILATAAVGRQYSLKRRAGRRHE